MSIDQFFKANFADQEPIAVATNNQLSYAIDSTELFETDSSVRNLCFVWADGRRVFFNYAYLTSAQLLLQDNTNVLVLYFSGQTVTLKGYHLGSLFELLLDHIPKKIWASDPRYYVDSQTIDIVVTDIHVKSE